MRPLSRDQLELIFDYCLGVADEVQLEQCRDLIATNPEAKDFYNKVQIGVGPLDEWAVEPCPDDLVAKTIARVNEKARSSQANLEKLLAVEGERTLSRSASFIGFGKRLAMAAAFMIVGSMAIMTWNSVSSYARQKSWQSRCETQLGGVWQGVSNYLSDHDSKLPSVATSAGSPWWKIGHQGKENVSNTRHVWLLVRGGYADADHFVCPGSSCSKDREPLTAEIIKHLNDFPDRQYIQYSFQLICGNANKISMGGPRALFSDLNPLFENLPSDLSRPLRLQMDDTMMQLNSINHNRRGQNILFCDGAVRFVPKRRMGTSDDDIFTLRGTSFYEGSELPTCDFDSFLAP